MPELRSVFKILIAGFATTLWISFFTWVWTWFLTQQIHAFKAELAEHGFTLGTWEKWRSVNFC